MGYPIELGRSSGGGDGRLDPATVRPMDAAAIFTDPEAYANADAWHTVAARLRREDPVCHIEAPGFDPFFAVTKHADVIEIERQPERWGCPGGC